MFTTNHTALNYELSTLSLYALLKVFHFFCLLLFTALVTYLLIHCCLLLTLSGSDTGLDHSTLRIHFHIPHSNTSQFHSRSHPFVVSFNSTVTMPHTRIVALSQLTLLRLVTCLICHVSQCSNNLLLSSWLILEHCGRVCLPVCYSRRV